MLLDRKDFICSGSGTRVTCKAVIPSNIGIYAAVQTLLNGLSTQFSIGTKIKIDGKIGPETVGLGYQVMSRISGLLTGHEMPHMEGFKTSRTPAKILATYAPEIVGELSKVIDPGLPASAYAGPSGKAAPVTVGPSGPKFTGMPTGIIGGLGIVELGLLGLLGYFVYKKFKK